jgi:hypothetical protein
LAWVVDDYHLIDSQAVHDSVGFLLTHLPPRLRLVLAGAETAAAAGQAAARGQLAGRPDSASRLCQPAVVPTMPFLFVSGTAGDRDRRRRGPGWPLFATGTTIRVLTGGPLPRRGPRKFSIGVAAAAVTCGLGASSGPSWADPPARRSPVSGPFRGESVIAPMPGGHNLAEHERATSRQSLDNIPGARQTTNGARQ